MKQNLDADLYEIKLPWACYGIFVENGIVIDSAPIGRKNIGRRIEQVERWVKSKHGQIYCLGKK